MFTNNGDFLFCFLRYHTLYPTLLKFVVAISKCSMNAFSYVVIQIYIMRLCPKNTIKIVLNDKF